MSSESAPSQETTGDAVKRAVRGGIGASALVQAAGWLTSLATLAVLFRHVPPQDYGLLGMVVPWLLLMRIFATLGLNIATVQRETLSTEELASLFWVNILLGLAATLLTALGAPVLAWFYDAPRLTLLTVALAATSIATAVGAQHQALMERNLQLGRLAVVRLVGQIGGSVLAIAAALAGWGVWALVIQLYAELVVLDVIVWIVQPWRPGWPRRGTWIGAHLRLGGFYSLSSVLFFVESNLDKILIGRLAGDRALGLYGQAFNLMIKPVYSVTTPLTGIMLAGLSRTAGEPLRQAEWVAAFYRLVAVVLLPVGVGLMVVGEEVMQLLGGAVWAPAGPILSVLSVAILAKGFLIITVPLFTAAGRTDRLFYGALVVTLALVASYSAGLWIGARMGHPAQGVAWGHALCTSIVLVPYSVYCLRTTGHPILPVLAAVRRPVAAALAMGVLVWTGKQLLADLAPTPRLLALVLGGALTYGLLARREIAWLASQWKQLAGH